MVPGTGKGAAKAMVAAGGTAWIIGRDSAKLDLAKVRKRLA